MVSGFGYDFGYDFGQTSCDFCSDDILATLSCAGAAFGIVSVIVPGTVSGFGYGSGFRVSGEGSVYGWCRVQGVGCMV